MWETMSRMAMTTKDEQVHNMENKRRKENERLKVKV
jgi:hypothetical protein